MNEITGAMVADPQITIMAVDDTPVNLKLLEELLRAHGYRVLCFPSGGLALEAAQRNAPDMILLDVNMPEMNGFDVCEALKSRPELKEIPVIFISAMGETMDKVRAFSLGGVDYITKPFQVEEVIARVNAHLKIRQLQKELEAKYARLKELEHWRDGLVHMIVHDLRSPLQALLTFSEVLMMDADRVDPSAQSVLKSIKDTAMSLNDMVSDVLDVSRMEEQRMPLQLERINLTGIVQDVARSLNVHLYGRSLVMDFPPEPPYVECDSTLIRRVLSNLLDNAIKFTPKGKCVSLRLTQETGAVRVEVLDEGQGIPTEYHHRIFDKFSQVEMRGKGARRSSGLGLTFSRLAVQAHQGEIGVMSREGQGSTFWFTLPMRQAAGASLAREGAS